MTRTGKHGLGRGLDALMGGTAEEALSAAAEAGDAVQELRVSEIDPNKKQARKSFDEAALKELAESISQVGVIQPVIVAPNGKRYQLIAGERRWRAAMLAGLNTIPAIVRDWDTAKKMEASLIENLQRENLNPVEEALGIRSLMDQCGYTQEQAASRLGKSRPAVANLLRLLALPAEVLELVKSGKLSSGHARALCALDDPKRQIRLADLCVNEGWTVRQLENIVKLPETHTVREKPPRDPAFEQMEHMARVVFGTKAVLDGNATKGRLVINYYSAEDLQRIWDALEANLPKETGGN
ncbi:MAG: ParB/RepB/Spo0J family partition protein [Clostridia bacterium]|nr:ParB/RepB/Spo0J family partition protein [Clostridia bacterium]